MAPKLSFLCLFYLHLNNPNAFAGVYVPRISINSMTVVIILVLEKKILTSPFPGDSCVGDLILLSWGGGVWFVCFNFVGKCLFFLSFFWFVFGGRGVF